MRRTERLVIPPPAIESGELDPARFWGWDRQRQIFFVKPCVVSHEGWAVQADQIDGQCGGGGGSPSYESLS